MAVSLVTKKTGSLLFQLILKSLHYELRKTIHFHCFLKFVYQPCARALSFRWRGIVFYSPNKVNMHEYKNNHEKKLSLNSYILAFVYVIYLKVNFKTFLNFSAALKFQIILGWVQTSVLNGTHDHVDSFFCWVETRVKNIPLI